MFKCPNCGLELEEATVYCPECGSLIKKQKVTLTSSTTADWIVGFFVGILLLGLLITLVSAIPGSLWLVTSVLSLLAYLAVGWYVRRYSRSLSWGIFGVPIGILLLFLGLLVLCNLPH